jgi:hypothetical protein
MSLNFAVYSGYEKGKITRKGLADKLGVTAFHSSEIVNKRWILDRVMKAIAEKIGRDHRESYPVHNFSSPKWKTLKRLGLSIILSSVGCQCVSRAGPLIAPHL